MAAYQSAYNCSLRGKPLYIFYDCEATGRDAQDDRIIEVGAVVCTYGLSPRTARALSDQEKDTFTSLCYCTHPIDPEAAKILPLTLRDLVDAPKLEEVLISFCDWIKERVGVAERNEYGTFTPVLVAHSGNLLDFPLKHKFEGLDIHYTDSHSTVRQLARSHQFYRSLPGKGVKDLHQGLLNRPYVGHRALADAQALHDIFMKCSMDKHLQLFGELRKFVQNKQGVEFQREQMPKFREAGITAAKAEELLMKGITYDKMLEEYRYSPHSFTRYLADTCGITKPKQELLDHFMFK